VELIDLSSKRVVTELQTDPDGNYLSTLPLGRDYAFSVNKKGYLFYSNRFMLKEVVSGDHFEVKHSITTIRKRGQYCIAQHPLRNWQVCFAA